MAEKWAYVTVKVNKDDVPSAIQEARAEAVKQLGEGVTLYEKTWTPGWLCTCWRLWAPDIPPSNP